MCLLVLTYATEEVIFPVIFFPILFPIIFIWFPFTSSINSLYDFKF